MARKGDIRQIGRQTQKELLSATMRGLLWQYLAGTLLTVFFSETMLLPAIPEIIKEFKIPYGTAAWIFSAYLIVAA